MLLQALSSNQGPWHLRHVICCGEALLPSTVDRFYDTIASRTKESGLDTRLHNVYGPTEASMTHHVCAPGASEVSIGEPIDNTTVRCRRQSVARARAYTHTHVCATDACARMVRIVAAEHEPRPCQCLRDAAGVAP